MLPSSSPTTPERVMSLTTMVISPSPENYGFNSIDMNIISNTHEDSPIEEKNSTKKHIAFLLLTGVC